MPRPSRRTRLFLAALALLCVLAMLALSLTLPWENHDPRLVGRWGFRLQPQLNREYYRQFSLSPDGHVTNFNFAVDRRSTAMAAGLWSWRVSEDCLILEPEFVPSGGWFQSLSSRFSCLVKKITGRLERFRFQIVQIQPDKMELRPIEVPTGRSEFVTRYDRLPDSSPIP